MNKLKCNFLSIWYTLRYADVFLLKGMFAYGHDLDYTGEICNDHWKMKCKRCGFECSSEIGPDAEIEEI